MYQFAFRCCSKSISFHQIQDHAGSPLGGNETKSQFYEIRSKRRDNPGHICAILYFSTPSYSSSFSLSVRFPHSLSPYPSSSFILSRYRHLPFSHYKIMYVIYRTTLGTLHSRSARLYIRQSLLKLRPFLHLLYPWKLSRQLSHQGATSCLLIIKSNLSCQEFRCK